MHDECGPNRAPFQAAAETKQFFFLSFLVVASLKHDALIKKQASLMDAFSDPTVVAEQEMVEQDKNLDLVVQRVRPRTWRPETFNFRLWR